MAEQDRAGETDETDDAVTEENVEHRASGRLPEEADSEDPEAQARAILEESEERTAAGGATANEG